jgi:hypothetical protein
MYAILVDLSLLERDTIRDEGKFREAGLWHQSKMFHPN